MIRFDNVSKRYPGGKDALSRVSFEIEAGEMVFLTGYSGAGKSTLMKLIIVMERATQGQVFVQGVNVNRIVSKKIPEIRRDIGVVFQNHQLLFDRTVFDNVALPLVIAGFHNREVGRRVRSAAGPSSIHTVTPAINGCQRPGECSQWNVSQRQICPWSVLLGTSDPY